MTSDPFAPLQSKHDVGTLHEATRVLMRRCKRTFRRDLLVSALKKIANRIEAGEK